MLANFGVTRFENVCTKKHGYVFPESQGAARAAVAVSLFHRHGFEEIGGAFALPFNEPRSEWPGYRRRVPAECGNGLQIRGFEAEFQLVPRIKPRAIPNRLMSIGPALLDEQGSIAVVLLAQWFRPDVTEGEVLVRALAARKFPTVQNAEPLFGRSCLRLAVRLDSNSP